MNYRQLGNSGLRVSVIGLGTNRFGGPVDQVGVTEALDLAEELGINFIDTADVYQYGRSEETIGHALKGRRKRFVVATKVYFKVGDGPNDYGASRYHIMQGVESSLERLQTDYIDLYQIHRWDVSTPIIETLRALDDLVSSGKVLYVGASDFASWQLAKANLLAEFHGWSSFITIQSHYHMLERDIEKEVLPYCKAHNIGFIPYFPLAGGFLTGKYQQNKEIPKGSRGESSQYVQDYMKDTNYALLEKLKNWVEDHNHSLTELAHSWLLAQPQVCSVISGMTRIDHLRSNAKSAEWVLTPEEITAVRDILEAG